MKTLQKSRRASMSGLAVILGIAALTTTAFGHPGHATGGLAGGLAHPLTGLDHMLTMVAIGIWAAQLGKQAIWMVPAAFLAFMAAGSALAFSGMHMAGSALDQGIAAALLLLGLLIVSACKMPVWAGASIAALFALMHGFAHGAELQAGASAMTYGAGFMLTTTVLLLTGLALAWTLMAARRPSVIRVAGASLAVLALMLMTGVL